MNRNVTSLGITLALLLSLNLRAADAPEPGQKTSVITCKKQDKFSYIMYYPKSYDPARAHKWPIMFVLSPSGGGPGTLDMYIDGAERNHFVLAVSIQSKNSNSEATAAGLAMIDDVLASCPAVDPLRCYTTGFSGGCRESFELSGQRKKNITGILACGAGCTFGNYNSKALVYGICGSKCFNRWDMTMTFNNRLKKNGVLRFFPAGHSWGNKTLIAEGMDWLNCQYLATKNGGPKSAVDEKTAFIKRIATDIEENLESNPEYAYERGQLLAKFTGPETAKMKAAVAKLSTNPKIKAYLAAEKAVDQFANRHFNTDVMDYKNKPVTKEMTRDAKILQEKYKDTPFAEILVGFGEACAKP
jgi:hypothetical protein